MHSILLKHPPIFHQSSGIPSIYRLLSMLGFHRGYSIFDEITHQGQDYEKETTSTTDCSNPYINAKLGICSCD
jgi:hypothetical protein